jgi:hypothetical protein
MPPPDGDQTDTSGRTGATPDGRTPDGWTPDGRTPDPGRRAQVTGHRADRTLDGPDSRAPDDGTGWVDTHAGRGPATDAMAGVLACRARRRSCPLDGRWTLGWAEASGRSTNQDSSAATTTRGITLLRTGLDHRHDRQLLGRFAGQAAPRRTAVLGRLRVERRASGWRSSVMSSAYVAAERRGPVGSWTAAHAMAGGGESAGQVVEG